MTHPVRTAPPTYNATGLFRVDRLSRFVMSVQGLFVTRLILIVLALGAWQLASGRLISAFWLSSPSAILLALARWIGDGTLWTNLQATLTAMGLGYVIGCMSGIIAGLLLGFMPLVQRIVMPYLGGLYCLPKIALAPLFVIVLGIDLGSKIALVAITVFFLVLYSTLDGINDLDRDLARALRLMGATRLEISTKVLIPGCLQWILTGMRIAVRYAFTATVLGEVIASNRGIGFLIESNAGQFDSTGVFAAVLVLVVCSITLSEILTRWETAKHNLRAAF